MLSDLTFGRICSARFRYGLLALVLLLAGVAPPSAVAAKVRAKPDNLCTDGPLPSPGNGKDLVVSGNGTSVCTVGAGTYLYGNVVILKGGTLSFSDTVTHFYAKSILIQNGGSLVGGVLKPGTPQETVVPIGTAGGSLTFHLYGAEQNKTKGQGVLCQKLVGSDVSADVTCGIDLPSSSINMMKAIDPATCVQTANLPGGVTDCFYMYDALKYDGAGGNLVGFFGYKVIGLSYGGTLRLYGKKGATYTDTKTGPGDPAAIDPSNTGTSWQRLDSCPGKKTDSSDPLAKCQDGVLQAGATKIKLSGPAKVDWQTNDWVILTTSDYLVSHSERVRVKSVDSDGLTITLQDATQYPHNASVFDLKSRIPVDRTGLTDLTAVDNRAAVGLLTRSIRVVSEGAASADAAKVPKPLPSPTAADDDRYFGGHMIIRQGFKQLQLQGVEMFQLGQGGKIGHYPIHFHMTRKVPADTFVKDCSIWDSFTRWIVVHATQNLLIARNVGYRSIGHGYYFEDGTETDNRLYANLGVSAIAAVDDFANERKIPGILVVAKDADPIPPPTPYKTDSQHPALFWFLNGWNDVEYNYAAGAEACGLCYWMVPGANSGGSRQMNWTTNKTPYASEQRFQSGISPIQKFVGNTCSTAAAAFSSISDVEGCNGVRGVGKTTPEGAFTQIENTLGLPKNVFSADGQAYYPFQAVGNTRHATLCGPDAVGDHSNDCSTVLQCADKSNGNCAVTTLDRFTTSFNYSETNFAAIWLRPQWSLVINSAMTDILNGGISFVTGGGYTRSDTPRGLWSLARKSVFIGNGQSIAGNKFTSSAGPVTPTSGRVCRNPSREINFCIPADAEGSVNKDGTPVKDDGTLFQISNHSTNRFFSIYDGPSLQDSNIYLDIPTTSLVKADGKTNDCTEPSPNTKLCANSSYMQGRVTGIPGLGGNSATTPATRPSLCYLPNAAIAWKQPNGFFYPPAFHSLNLFFDKVSIRHYLIEPNFIPPTGADPDPYQIDLKASLANYCNVESSMWNGFTDVDRQTELNDDDGSLTGLVKTISVNSNKFFLAPTEDFECKSDIPGLSGENRATAKSSPYDYVTTVLYPDGCSKSADTDQLCNTNGAWKKQCTNNRCFGVPLNRELLVKGEKTPPIIHMSGQRTGQRSTLTPNNGRWYIDTTVSQQDQQKSADDINVFASGDKYHMLLLFAKPNDQGKTNQSRETYDIFIGKGADRATVLAGVEAEKADISAQRMTFTSFDTSADWKAIAPWTKDYDPGTGMLTVTMDMSLGLFATDYNNSIKGRCQPLSMCKWDDNLPDTTPPADRCKCNTSSSSYLPDDCKNNATGICKWAVADIDYPDAGAYGFSFTIPNQFAYGAQKVPAVSCLTKANNPQWDISFVVPQPPPTNLAGDCTYNSSPPAPIFSQNATPGANGCQ